MGQGLFLAVLIIILILINYFLNIYIYNFLKCFNIIIII